MTPSITWLNPFAEGGAALTAGLLLGVFAYWGWESAVNLTEETDGLRRRPRAGPRIVSTVVLLVTYVRWPTRWSPSPAPDFLAENEDEDEPIFALLGDRGARRLGLGPAAVGGHLGARVHPDHDHPGVPDRAVDGAAARPAARAGAHPPALPHPGRVHLAGGRRSPSAWYVLISLISENALFDSITALSLLIAFYYSLTGIACAVYYRRS